MSHLELLEAFCGSVALVAASKSVPFDGAAVVVAVVVLGLVVAVALVVVLAVVGLGFVVVVA